MVAFNIVNAEIECRLNYDRNSLRINELPLPVLNPGSMILARRHTTAKPVRNRPHALGAVMSKIFALILRLSSHSHAQILALPHRQH